MANGDDVRMIKNRGLPERKRLREPQLRYRTKKPRLRAGKLKLDRDFINSLKKSPAMSQAVPPAGGTEASKKIPPQIGTGDLPKSRPTDTERGLTHPDAKSLGHSLWNQPLQEPKVDGAGGLPPRLVLREPTLDARSVMNSRLTDVDRGLQSKPWLGTRRLHLWDSRHPKPSDDTVIRRTKNLIMEACTAAGWQDLAALPLAIAMQEASFLTADPDLMTEEQKKEYPFGDKFPDLKGDPGRCHPELEKIKGYPPGCPKTGDNACFGIYKMNWGMIKECESAKKILKELSPNLKAEDVWRKVGEKINKDPSLATKILIEAMTDGNWHTWEPDPANPELDNFWAGHVWGSSGLKNEAPPIPGITKEDMWNGILVYYKAIQTIIKDIEEDPIRAWGSDYRRGEPVPPK